MTPSPIPIRFGHFTVESPVMIIQLSPVHVNVCVLAIVLFSMCVWFHYQNRYTVCKLDISSQQAWCTHVTSGQQSVIDQIWTIRFTFLDKAHASSCEAQYMRVRLTRQCLSLLAPQWITCQRWTISLIRTKTEHFYLKKVYVQSCTYFPDSSVWFCLGFFFGFFNCHAG